MKRFSILLTCVIIALATGLVSGQSQSSQQTEADQPQQRNRAKFERQNRQRNNRGEKIGRRLARMDADKDQKISRGEWKLRPKAFDRLDANHDGFITREEIMALRGQRRQRSPNEAKPPTN